MKKVGNVASNKNYNPQNKKPPTPIDADEADSAMERFIRSKYTNTTLGTTARHHTGSTESDETPPPLPPKTPGRFGFRSASSIFPLGSKSKKAARDGLSSPRELPASPRRGIVPSDMGTAGNFERKLARLRDMGFTDNQRNTIVLKGVNGSLERAVEALVRLGEGNKASGPGAHGLAAQPSRKDSVGLSVRSDRTMPTTPRSAGQDSFEPRPMSAASPFDALDRPPTQQPLSSQSTGTLQSRNPYVPSTNPFGLAMQQSNPALNQAFQNLSLAPSQPLFPHHTGGVGQHVQQVTYPQPTTPQPPLLSQGLWSTDQTYCQPSLNAQQAGSYNPFFAHQQQQQQQQHVQFQQQQESQVPFQQEPQQQQFALFQQPPQQQSQALNTGGYGSFGNNPFARSPARIQSPALTQIPEQAQPTSYPLPAQLQVNNPFFSQPSAQSPGQVTQPAGATSQDYFAQHLQMSRAPQHVDTKASILALYSHPQLAGNAPQSQQQLPGQDHNQASADQSAPAQQQPQHQDPFAWAQTFPSQDQMQQQQQQQHNHYTTQNQGRAVSVSPAPGTNNPFLFNGSEASSPGPTKPASLHHQQQQAPPSLIDFTSKQNGSRDSMMATGLDWGSGRHSPDAFASLSARDVR